MTNLPKLSALKKNILKYRALQMILLLHQVESLKSFVIGSIRATEQIFSKTGEERLPEGTKNLFRKAWALLVEEHIITEEEREDIQRIIDFRNNVSHSIHDLVSDISARDLSLSVKRTFDYLALQRLQMYRDRIERGMREKFILQVGFRELAFEEAEKTYGEELNRLKKKIDRQYAAFRKIPA